MAVAGSCYKVVKLITSRRGTRVRLTLLRYFPILTASIRVHVKMLKGGHKGRFFLPPGAVTGRGQAIAGSKRDG